MGLIVTLIVVGLLLVLAEVFLIPGFGVTGILGLLSMGGACFYAFYSVSKLAGMITLAVVLLLIILVVVFMLRAKTWKRMTLETNIDSKAVESADRTLAAGDKGKSITRLAPMGSVRFSDDVYEAKALEGMIDPGVEVEIVLIEDNKVYVKPVSE